MKSEKQTYRMRIWRRFRQHKPALWSLRILYLLLFLAIFADFLANEKPLYCKIEGKNYFPVFRQYAVDLGWSRWENQFVTKEWKEHKFEAVVFAPIPYSATTQDNRNRGLVGPFSNQQISSNRFRHWLGTDQLGRDVAAGMVAGTRVAMLVGVIAMSIATLIGVFFGSLAGYFGDNNFKISRIRLFLNILAFIAGIFYAFTARYYFLSVAAEEGGLVLEILKSVGLFLLIFLIANGLANLLKFFSALAKKVTIPLDLWVMRLIEIMNSIPALLLLLAVVAIIDKPSIFYVMAIIGLIRWTGIARFLRAELLKIRKLEYIDAARALGFSNWRIIWRHALPNAITPVLITIAFGVASAVLLEAFMSFLGIGVAAEDVTWGSMLSLARQNFSAWWLAVFPGFAIFITVTIFNLIGEGLTEAMDVKS